MQQSLNPRVVDWLLYNRAELRARVEAMQPPGAAGLVQIPVHRRINGSEVEQVAISRAAISVVLDAVDRSLASMPRGLRRLARLRYDQGMTIYAIAHYTHWSERTCYRRADKIRQSIESSLSLLEGQVLAVFWQEIGRVLAG